MIDLSSNIKKYSSKNFNSRPQDTKIDTIVLHHTALNSNESALEMLLGLTEREVSAHYLISKSGEIYNLVPDEYRAWHAGVSYWREKTSINDNSIGIELDNNGCELFTAAQMQSLVALCQHLINIHPIEQRNIIAHADVAPNRKQDPSHFLDWEHLSEAGIGFYPIYTQNNYFKEQLTYEEAIEVQRKLNKFGYQITVDGDLYNLQSQQVIAAFKRHYCNTSYSLEENLQNTLWDAQADYKLNVLMEKINVTDGLWL